MPRIGLSAEQRAAVVRLLQALDAGECCSLIGPAGSGKSFTLAAFLRELEEAGRWVKVGLPAHTLRASPGGSWRGLDAIRRS